MFSSLAPCPARPGASALCPAFRQPVQRAGADAGGRRADRGLRDGGRRGGDGDGRHDGGCHHGPPRQRPGDRHLLGRARPHRPSSGAGPRDRRPVHTGRAERLLCGHSHPADARRSPARGRGARLGAQRTLDGLDAVAAAGNGPARQPPRHCRHGPHWPGRRPARPRLRRGGSLPQPHAPAYEFAEGGRYRCCKPAHANMHGTDGPAPRRGIGAPRWSRRIQGGGECARDGRRVHPGPPAVRREFRWCGS